MKYLTPLILIIFISCDGPAKKTGRFHVCNCDQIEKATQFMQSSIGPSNNMSDEEMEDVIYELRRTSILMYCEERTLDYLWTNNKGVVDILTPLDSCEKVVRY